MDEWLGIFNVKLRHMREDIESVGRSIDVFINSVFSGDSCMAENFIDQDNIVLLY